MRYRKKPVVIDAVLYDGNNHNEIKEFCPSIELYGIDDDGASYLRANPVIHTLEGDMLLKPGDYLIKGIEGEFYPCKPNIFENTYEKV